MTPGTMLCIPLQISAHQFSVFVILGDDNLERIKGYDPAEVTTEKFGAPWNQLALRDVVIGYATPAEREQLTNAIKSGDASVIREQLRHLSRGWRFDPTRGDGDHRVYRSAL